MSARDLGALERGKDALAPAEVLRLVRRLARARLASAGQVRRLHEVLCYLRAFPGERRVLATAERALAAFPRRTDLRERRAELAHAGIAGTAMGYPFFHPTARYLARRWPKLLVLDRDDALAGENIAGVLPQLLTPLEAAALKELDLAGYAALERFLPRGASDAAFFAELVESLGGDGFAREALYDRVNPSCVLLPGRDTPARGRERFPPAPLALGVRHLRRASVDLGTEITRAPRGLRELTRLEGQALVDLAREAMIARSRDLDAFAYGEPRGAWLVDDGDGLAFAFAGMLPERRVLLSAVFGGLMLQNGVPIGYTQVDVLGHSAALSFNLFPTFRGGAGAHLFARWLAALHASFGTRSFSVEPYQLGRGNEEGIESGAFWFYAKQGFRPRDPAVLRLFRAEAARLSRAPGRRSSPATLRRLAAAHVFFELDPARPAPLPPAIGLGLALARALGRRPGGRREACEALAREALALAGSASYAGFTLAERLAWRRFGPLLCLIPGFARWKPAERRAAGLVLRAKGAPSERLFVARLAAHARLLAALEGGARRL